MGSRSVSTCARHSIRLCCLMVAFSGIAAANDSPGLPDGRRNIQEEPSRDDGRKPVARLDPRTVLEADYRPLTASQRAEVYLRQTFVPGGAYYGPLFSTIRDQISGEPGEWGGGTAGFARRFGSNVGEAVIRGTIRSGLAALLREDPRVIVKREGSFFSRIGHATAFTVLTLDEHGGRRVSASTIGSYFATSFIAQAAWQPDRLRSKDAVREAGRHLLGSLLIKQAQEFWPEIRRHVLRRR